MYSYQPEGWLDPHTVPAPDAHIHTHIPACTYAHAQLLCDYFVQTYNNIACNFLRAFVYLV
jgi:hypothetical protein